MKHETDKKLNLIYSTTKKCTKKLKKLCRAEGLYLYFTVHMTTDIKCYLINLTYMGMAFES